MSILFLYRYTTSKHQQNDILLPVMGGAIRIPEMQDFPVTYFFFFCSFSKMFTSITTDTDDF